VAGPQATSTGRERLASLHAALASRGFQADPELIYAGDFQAASGREGARYLLDLPSPPTAVIAADSLMTLGVLQMCAERSVRIGTQLSLIGYDDVDAFNVVNPPLTVIAHNPEEMGRVAVVALTEVLAGKRPRSQVLPCQLKVRGSTGPVSNAGRDRT
jgi:LacI family transcriptional regulator